MIGGLEQHMMFYCLSICCQRLRNEDWNSLEKCGLEPDLAKHISELPFEGLLLMSDVGSPHVNFSFNSALLRNCLAYVLQEIRKRQLKDEYLLGDAPGPLMEKLFAINANDYTARRKALGLPEKKRGPLLSPSLREQQIVIAALRELAALPLKIRLLEVREKTGLSFDTIWGVVRELNIFPPERESEVTQSKRKHNHRKKSIA